jgi:AcrR family transcriptional regulator
MPPTASEPAILGRRERKKRETRKRIFSEALQLFLEKGFDAVTVEEIAERADVGKGTVFNYFPQKTAFLIAAYSEWVEVIRENLGPVDSWQGPVRDQLSRLFETLVDLAFEHRVLSRQIIFETMRQTHLRMTRWEAARADAGERMEGAEEAEAGGGTGDGSGEDRPEDDNPDPEALRLLEGMVREVVQKGQARGEIRAAADEAQAASLIAAVCFHTIVRGQVRNRTAPQIKNALAGNLDIIFTGLDP